MAEIIVNALVKDTLIYNGTVFIPTTVNSIRHFKSSSPPGSNDKHF
ncbi:hypothetical protein PBCVAN69C_780L [Paramecium bursaria Chlorella virus AN69C]|nr:hypothetical protein PBCVAN69C_780L [Paramecium bursaria Chlorella virus AN69C]